MGWIAFFALVAVAALLLWRGGYPRKLWMVPASALMLAAAGYSWSGMPGLAGRPVAAHAPDPASVDPDPGLSDVRGKLYGIANYSTTYFVASEAMARRGKADQAVTVLLGGTRSVPRDGGLWAALGLALTMRDGAVSPPAQLAFDRGFALWPEHPGPWFYLGLARLHAGQLGDARAAWRRAIALSPSDAPYRADFVARMAILDRMIGESGADAMGGIAQGGLARGTASAPDTTAAPMSGDGAPR